MLRKTALISALAACALATPLHAEEHYVLMLGHGYFPVSVHPAVGDTIRFVNITDIPMAATAQDGTWSTGLLGQDAAFVLPVVDGMTMEFTNSLPEPTEGDDALIAASGVVDYVNPAPVDLDAEGKPVDLPDEVVNSNS